MSTGKSRFRRRAKQQNSNRTRLLGLAAALALVAVPGYHQIARSQTAAVPALATSAATERALLDKYCVTCHNQRLKTGGLSLDLLDPAKMHDHAEEWEKVVRKLRAG